MADLVQASMERMVPDFEALEERGYFSKEELRQVINRRLHFEYLVKSRARTREDFLSYIEYEMKLEELRGLRWKDLPKAESDQKKHRADACIIRHIHGIFARATRCYKGDLQLWMEWFQFCKLKKSTNKLSKAITEALRYNSHCPDLWILAGQWEFNERGNPHAARSLMLLGIRMCNNSEIIWAEYFKMELVFAARLAARRQIMGIGTEKGTFGKEHDAMTGVIKGQAAALVLHKALESFPHSLNFRKQLLEHASTVKFPGCGDIINKIFASIVEDFPEDAGAWDLKARYCYSITLTSSSESRSVDSAEEVYMAGLDVAPSKELGDHFYTFLDEVLECAKQSKANTTDGDKGLPELKVKAKLLNCCCLAAKKGVASEDLLLKWISLTNITVGVEAATQAAQTAIELTPNSSSIWCSYLNCYWLSCSRTILDDPQLISWGQLEEMVEKAMASVPQAQQCKILQCALNILASTSTDIEWIVLQVVSALKKPKSEQEQQSFLPLLCSILQILWRNQGIAAARTFYTNMLDTFKCPEQFYISAIVLELDPGQEDAAGDKRIKYILEKAVNSHPSSLDIWMKYAEYENMQGRRFDKLCSRAAQSLTAHSMKDFVDYTKDSYGRSI